MQRIELHGVVPDVFRGTDLRSEVWGTDLSFTKGEVCLVEAASGRGKTSLCSFLYGWRDDYSGTVLFDGRDIRSFGDSSWTRIRQRSLSMIFQELRLFPQLTAYENVRIKNDLTGYKSREWIVDCFDRLGIADKLDTKVKLMSFGQQQRVALVRALCQPFDFIFCDEPVSHLDDGNGALLARLLMEEAASNGAGVIVTSIGKHAGLDYGRRLLL